MNVCSLSSFFLTISMVNFEFCESQNSYKFDSEYIYTYFKNKNPDTLCQEYQINSNESFSVHNEMKFEVKSFEFRIAIVQEKINSSSWAYIEIVSAWRRSFDVHFGASRNPDLNPYLIGLVDDDSLIGSFEKLNKNCFINCNGCSFLMVKWEPPYTPFFGDINLYFNFGNEDILFKKALSFDVKSQKTKSKEDEEFIDTEVPSEKPKSNVVESNVLESTGTKNSSNVLNFAVPIALFSISICICIFLYFFVFIPFSKDADAHQSVNVMQWRHGDSHCSF